MKVRATLTAVHEYEVDESRYADVTPEQTEDQKFKVVSRHEGASIYLNPSAFIFNRPAEITVKIEKVSADDPPMVAISQAEFRSLSHAAAELDALKAGGVDNWEWYSDSLNDHYDEAEVEARAQAYIANQTT